MKNLYNKISQQEKKRILEMHTGMKKTIKEQYDDRNGMNWVQNTTMDRQRPMDEPMFEEGSFESILKKYNLLDKVDSPTKENRLFMRRQSSKVVQKLLSILHLFDTVIFLAILECESADFSDVDICGLPNLTFINLQGTENNFNEQGYECLENEGNGMYFHKEG